MSLTKNQFDVLSFFAQAKGHPTQRDTAHALGKSLGLVNKTLAELKALGCIDEKGEPTEKGNLALEPYRVKRAVIIAAGFSSRLAPVTLSTPKPLVRVHGKRIIDSLLDALTAAGITEIYVIRGYRGEQFEELKQSYPSIRFIENPRYNEENNISSMVAASGHFENAYVCEADLILQKPGLISKYQYHTNYLAFQTDKTDDWCFYERNGCISRLSVGGVRCWQMIGISYWNEEDGRRLSRDIRAVYDMPGGKERYWDQVPLEYRLKDYNVRIRECVKNDIIEIDTFPELKSIDAAYC